MSKGAKRAAEALAAADMAAVGAAAEHRDSAPVRLLSAVAKLGDQPELRLISGAVIASGIVLRSGRLLRAGVRMLLAHEVATSAKRFAKNRIDRTRPRNAGSKRQARPRPGTKTDKKHTSFPSGHSAGAIAVAQAFGREFPGQRLPALAAAGTIATGQVPKGAHYPSDIAAGLLIGAASEALTAAAWAAADRAFGSEGPAAVNKDAGPACSPRPRTP